MKTLLLLCLLSMPGIAADKKDGNGSESNKLDMSAHEVKGIDRKALSVVIEDDDGNELSLSGIEGSKSEWKEKMDRTTEEMSWW